MKPQKKSQMEIMGLAIIVILITVGIFFYIGFRARQQPVDQKQEFGNVQLATNIINSILETTTENCYGLTFSEVLQRCASNTGGYCSEGVTTTYCDYFRSQLKAQQPSDPAGILDLTLDEWVPNYGFYVKKVGDDTEISGLADIKDGCLSGEKIAKRFTIPSNPPSYILLEIC